MLHFVEVVRDKRKIEALYLCYENFLWIIQTWMNNKTYTSVWSSDQQKAN